MTLQFNAYSEGYMIGPRF